MIRLDFPGFSGGESLEAVSWDEWFRAFDENNLALLVQDETAGGEQSNFNKLVSRQTAAGQQRSRRAPRAGGRTDGLARRRNGEIIRRRGAEIRRRRSEKRRCSEGRWGGAEILG